MAGLLDFMGGSIDDPRTAATLQLAQGLLAQRGMGGLVGGMQGYLGTMAQAKEAERRKKLEEEDRAMKRGLLSAQIAETLAQQKQREAEAAKFGRIENAMAALLQPSAPNQYGAAGSGIRLGGVGEQMTQRPAGLAGATLEDVVKLKAVGGPDLLEAWKTAQTGQKLEAGQWYQKADGSREYIVNPDKGVTMKNGSVSLVPGALDTQTALAGALKGVEARAGANFDLVAGLNPDGSPGYLGTRADIADRLRGKYSAAPNTPAGQTSRLAEVSAAEDDIRRWAESLRPGGAKTAAPTDQQPPAMRTGLSPADTWTADPARGVMRNGLGQTKPMTDSATGKPIGSEKEATDASGFNKFLSASSAARTLLAKGPTESGIGTFLDKAGSFVGYPLKGAAPAEALRAVSGWMVANVPRMEGPQSNADVQAYQEMAAAVGDSTKPVSVRLAALTEAENLIKKYAALNKVTAGDNIGGQDAPPTGDQFLNSLRARAAEELAKRNKQREGGATGSF